MKSLRVYTVIFVFLILAGCTPIGGIGAGSDGVYDTFWIVPKCWEYEVNTWFLRDSDLAVFGSSSGDVIRIPIDAVSIGVIEDPETSPDIISPVPSGDDYPFTSIGRKIIVVNYETMSDRYTVQVKDTFGVTNPGGNNGGTGVIIEWGS